MKTSISILLVNPWIFDFAAYNLWVESLGLEYIGAILKNVGIHINGIDCLNSKTIKNPKEKPNGCSKFFRTIIQKPEKLHFVKRNYARYGISPEEFLQNLKEIVTPDLIFVTSIMTYWYPGLFYTIKLLKRVYGEKIPIILGGIYASLCKEHAREFSGADIIYSKREIIPLLKLIEDLTEIDLDLSNISEDFSAWPNPDHTIFNIKSKNFFSVLTRRGCIYRCSYCASPVLNKSVETREISSIIEEFTQFSSLLKTENIAFYDDALLLDSEKHIVPLLERIIENKYHFNFHLPNAIHSRFLTDKVANLMFKSGFKTIRIGLETANKILQKSSGNKVSNKDYIKSIEILKKAGFKKRDIGVYILVGLPDQTPQDVEATIKFVEKSGASPYLSFYSPIPQTALFKRAAEISGLDLEKEPLYHNNSVYILKHPNFTENDIGYLKDIAKEIRHIKQDD